MTEHSPNSQPPDFELRPPGAPFQEFSEWIADHEQTDTPDHTSEELAPDESVTESVAASVDMRVFLSTLTYGLLWVVTAFIAAQMSAGETGQSLRLIGLALITWATALGCELTVSALLDDDYPAWGMWAWINHPQAARISGKAQQAIGNATNNGCFLAVAAGAALPAIFFGAWAILAAFSVARELWVASIVTASAIHIAVTARRCYQWWRHNAGG